VPAGSMTSQLRPPRLRRAATIVAVTCWVWRATPLLCCGLTWQRAAVVPRAFSVVVAAPPQPRDPQRGPPMDPHARKDESDARVQDAIRRPHPRLTNNRLHRFPHAIFAEHWDGLVGRLEQRQRDEFGRCGLPGRLGPVGHWAQSGGHLAPAFVLLRWRQAGPPLAAVVRPDRM
jgi:hypothetical protein